MTACSGALDAAAYLHLHAFIANMTGDTVLLGLGLGGRHLGNAAHAGGAIAGFFGGALVAALLGRAAGEHDRWPRELCRAFAFEVALLIAVALLWHGAPAIVLLALGAAAMGAQSAITRDLCGAGISTTFMTGTVARIGEFLADALRMNFGGGLPLNFAAWVVYAGAAAGAAALDVRGDDVGALFWIVAAVIAAVGSLGAIAVHAALPPRRGRATV